MNRKVNIEIIRFTSFKCKICGYIYDSEKGDEKRAIMPGIDFFNLPDNWRCPVCQYPKSHFYIFHSDRSKKI